VTVWDDFFVAEVGASAALAGLLFVGISINMSKIVAYAWLPNMAGRALSLLVSVLIIASILLIPGQVVQWLGLELLGVGIAVCVLTSWVSISGLRRTEAQYRTGAPYITTIVTGTTVLYPVSGVVVLLAGLVGLYILVPAVLLSFVLAIFDSWVLLVEINR
jgi:hypothetical protein